MAKLSNEAITALQRLMRQDMAAAEWPGVYSPGWTVREGGRECAISERAARALVGANLTTVGRGAGDVRQAQLTAEGRAYMAPRSR